MAFLFRCELKFDELPGTSDQHRRCDICAKLVTNLDALEGDERRAFLERAKADDRTVCVSMTVETPTKPCGGRERLDAIAAAKLRPVPPLPTLGTVPASSLPKR